MATITDKKYGVGHKIKLKNISKINKKVHAILVQHGYKDESKFEKISANFEIEIELSINCSLYVILKDENSRIIKLSGDGVLNRIFNHDGKGQRGSGGKDFENELYQDLINNKDSALMNEISKFLDVENSSFYLEGGKNTKRPIYFKNNKLNISN